MEAFHLKSRRLTDVSGSSVSSAYAFACNFELLDAQERSALLIMALAVV